MVATLTEKNRAHQLVIRAIKKGTLIRPTQCSKCGVVIDVDRIKLSLSKYKKYQRTDKMQKELNHFLARAVKAHHDDYSKPLDVRWLCASCHAQFHIGKSEAATK